MSSSPRVPARFRIKIAKHRTSNPVILKDRARPAFVGQYPTLERACRAMDNTVRRELGKPERMDWSGVGMYSRDLDNRRPAFSAQDGVSA